MPRVAVGISSGGWKRAWRATATHERVHILLRQRRGLAEVAMVAVVAVIYSLNLIEFGLDYGANSTGPMSWPKRTATT